MSRTFMVHSSQTEAWDEIKALDKEYEVSEAQHRTRLERDYQRSFVWLFVGAALCYSAPFLM
jgi:hypothetical protein